MSRPPALCPSPDRIILFTRYPEAGRAKTRLIPVLGPQGAAELQRRLSAHAFRAAREACDPIEVRRWRSGSRAATRGGVRAWLGRMQRTGRGARATSAAAWSEACSSAAAAGAKRVVLVGADIPGLRAEHLREAFARLDAADLVFGPALDGGLLPRRRDRTGPAPLHGFPRPRRALELRRARFPTRLARVRAAGLTHALIEPLADIDRPEDLAAAMAALGRDSRTRATVVIPALNEEANLPDTLRSLPRGGGGNHRGGRRQHRPHRRDSRRRRRAPAALRPAAVDPDERRRGRPERRHPDLPARRHPPASRTSRARRARPSTGPGTAAGAFRLRIERTRAPVCGWSPKPPTGARACCRCPTATRRSSTTRDRFWRLGGFRALPLMEDFELVRGLRRHGRIRSQPGHVLTSARRWREAGPRKDLARQPVGDRRLLPRRIPHPPGPLVPRANPITVLSPLSGWRSECDRYSGVGSGICRDPDRGGGLAESIP
ncbi:MAG: DUF2064 domain-containing protein [Rhodopseudomonas palustris]|nr:DUF2064 domain-containing protein [Rhodopseudomonas palustris]